MTTNEKPEAIKVADMDLNVASRKILLDLIQFLREKKSELEKRVMREECQKQEFEGLAKESEYLLHKIKNLGEESEQKIDSFSSSWIPSSWITNSVKKKIKDELSPLLKEVEEQIEKSASVHDRILKMDNFFLNNENSPRKKIPSTFHEARIEEVEKLTDLFEDATSESRKEDSIASSQVDNEPRWEAKEEPEKIKVWEIIKENQELRIKIEGLKQSNQKEVITASKSERERKEFSAVVDSLREELKWSISWQRNYFLFVLFLFSLLVNSYLLARYLIGKFRNKNKKNL